MNTFNLISDPKGVDSVSDLQEALTERVETSVRWVAVHPSVLGLMKLLYHGPFRLPAGPQVAFLFDGEQA